MKDLTPLGPVYECVLCMDRHVVRYIETWVRCPKCNPAPDYRPGEIEAIKAEERRAAVSVSTHVREEDGCVGNDTSVRTPGDGHKTWIDPVVQRRCIQCFGAGVVPCNFGQETKECPACIDSTEQLLTFRAICEMIMASDPTPLSRTDDARVTTWADARANEYGYPSWEAAYHMIGRP